MSIIDTGYMNTLQKLHSNSDKVYQLLAHGRWFSPGTSASSTTKSGRHDIVEILLKVYLQSRARTHIKGSYPQQFPSIWVLNNLVVSEIPLISIYVPILT
jgi:hypothetical protein